MTRKEGKRLIRDWRDDIKIGTVLYERGDMNRPRIVREVAMSKGKGREGFLCAVTFSILRCSWTHRPYTVVCRSDLKCRGFTPAGVRVTSMTLMDKRLNAAIIDLDNRRLSCCDVRGMR
jgi:hypothetical protein